MEYIFSAAHGTYSKIDHILGHKASLKRHQNTEIISSILSDHKGINYKLIARETIQTKQADGD
jgi:hypothetical protein